MDVNMQKWVRLAYGTYPFALKRLLVSSHLSTEKLMTLEKNFPFWQGQLESLGFLSKSVYLQVKAEQEWKHQLALYSKVSKATSVL